MPVTNLLTQTSLLSLVCFVALALAAETGAEGAAAGVSKEQWRGLHLMVSSADDVQPLKRLITEALVPMGVNVLVLEVDYNFQFQSHPELSQGTLTKAHAREIFALCRKHGIRVIPLFNCLGHQSWAKKTFTLLTKYPEFDETPNIPKDNPGIYCRSWCPLHPGLNPIVFALMDELIDAFQADGIHVGMDEVFLIASDQCPRCKGKDPAELFAKAVNGLHKHLVGGKKVKMLMWGDRLIGAKDMGYGKWEASANGTAPAINMIPKDIILCDWHYGARESYPSVHFFQEKGFRVLPAPWKDVRAAGALIEDSKRGATERMLGILCTGWSAGGGGRSLAKVLLDEVAPEEEKKLAAARGIAKVLRASMKAFGGGSAEYWQENRQRKIGEKLDVGKMLANLDKPPRDGKLLAVINTQELASASITRRGEWETRLYPQESPKAFVISFDRHTSSVPGDFCQITFKLRPPKYEGKLSVQIFLTDELVTDKWTGYRFYELLHGDQVIWEEDIALDRAGREWSTIALPQSVRAGDPAELTLRLRDRKGVHDYGTTVFVGPVRLVEIP